MTAHPGLGRVAGLILAQVTDVDDPEALGRVRVRFLSRPGDEPSDWAPIARPLASGGFGLWMQPLVDDVVLIACEEGHLARPYVLGAIFTADNQPPTTTQEQRVLRTGGGHSVTLDDTSGSEAITIEDASGNVVRMEAAGITIESAADVTIKGVNVTIEASAQLTAKGAPIHLNP